MEDMVRLRMTTWEDDVFPAFLNGHGGAYFGDILFGVSALRARFRHDLPFRSSRSDGERILLTSFPFSLLIPAHLSRPFCPSVFIVSRIQSTICICSDVHIAWR